MELSWKPAKKVMGTSAVAPKQVNREMAQSGLIENVEFWLRSIDQKNLSLYTYNEKLAESYRKNFNRDKVQL